MSPKNKLLRVKNSGFSLVEIMVGLAIGLITSLIIMQVITVFEGDKRTTSGNTDAQTSGSIALYLIQRRVQMAGYGLPIFSDSSPLNCSTATFDHDGNAVTANIGIAPVSITDGGTAAGASDTITVRYGTAQMGATPLKIVSVDTLNKTLTLNNNLGCQVNDIALLVDGTTCNMSKVTAVTGTTFVSLGSSNGAVPTSGKLACMGGWSENTYQVVNGNLVENGIPVMSNIVNIQAQYGISNSASSPVTAWVDASGATWAAPSVANRNRIKAIRIAVVARNGLLEKDVVVNAPCNNKTAGELSGLCTWAGNDGSTSNASSSIDLTSDPNWQNYRYRVFETTIPLRNVIWSAGALQ